MGARGNSGVILSQLFRGFCKNIEDEKELMLNNLLVVFKQVSIQLIKQL